MAGIGVLAWSFVVWRWNDPFTAFYTHREQAAAPPRAERARGDDAPRLRSRSTPAAAKPSRGGAARGGRAGRASARGPRRPRGARSAGWSSPGSVSTWSSSTARRPRRSSAGRASTAHVHARRGRAVVHRRPPDDVRSAVRQRRPPSPQRPDHGRDAVRDAALPRHATSRSSTTRISPCSARRHIDVLALQACHPRFFATQRYIVWATLRRVSVKLDGLDVSVGGGSPRRRRHDRPISSAISTYSWSVPPSGSGTTGVERKPTGRLSCASCRDLLA